MEPAAHSLRIPNTSRHFDHRPLFAIKMSCEYNIGFKRYLAIKAAEHDSVVITLYEMDSNKFDTLSLVRWARFMSKLYLIDEQLERLRNGLQVESQTHIGGKLYASNNYKLKWPMVDLRGGSDHLNKVCDRGRQGYVFMRISGRMRRIG